MNRSHLEIGKIGEDKTAEYLKQRGFKLIDRNYRKPWGEIDIVAQRKGDYYFIEVKTLSFEVGNGVNYKTREGYDPSDHMNLEKRRRLARVIQTYLLEKGKDEDLSWQVDLSNVYLDKEGNLIKIDYLEDVPLD